MKNLLNTNITVGHVLTLSLVVAGGFGYVLVTTLLTNWMIMA